MKIRDNVPMAEEEKKKSWPFKDMKPGKGCLEIDDHSEWMPALRRAHAYAAAQNPKWKFQGKWLASKRVGRIRRVK